MKKSWSLWIAAVIVSGLTSAGWSQDQYIDCRKLADGIVITIDGDPSDWPLDSFGEPAEWPDMDPSFNFDDTGFEEREANGFVRGDLKTGDHFVYDPKKVLIPSWSGSDSFQAEDNSSTGEVDLAATTYIACPLPHL